MKILVSLLVFALVTALSIPSLADHHEAKVGDAGHEAGGHKKGHRDNNALFPPKQPNKALSAPPAATTLTAPAFMAKVSAPEATLTWKEVEGVTAYHVQVATDPVFKWLKFEDKLYKGTSYQVKDLEPGKHYYWRVAAMKPENMPSYSKAEFVKSVFETPAK